MPSMEQVFGVSKPVIAMVHFPALPGTPLYDEKHGVDAILEAVHADLLALQEAGVDAVMFGNESDRPYELRVDPASTATMAAVIGRLKPQIRSPFGVDVLWDTHSTLSLAAATGAHFAREVFTGVYGSDMGIWEGRSAAALRYRRLLGRNDLFLLYNVSAEFASPLDTRSLVQRAKSAVFSSLADAVLVSGPMTGEPAPLEHLEQVKSALGQTPVLANTGVSHDSIREVLRISDGCVVGTALKVGGITWNGVDPERAASFMSLAREARGG